MDLSNYDHPDDIESDGSFVYVDPEKLRQGAAGLWESADALDQVVKTYENFVNQLGEPWGSENEEFGKEAKKILLPLVEDYPEFLGSMAVSVQDTVNETLKMERNQTGANEYGVEIANNFEDSLGDIDGGGGGRRGG